MVVGLVLILFFAVCMSETTVACVVAATSWINSTLYSFSRTYAKTLSENSFAALSKPELILSGKSAVKTAIMALYCASFCFILLISCAVSLATSFSAAANSSAAFDIAWANEGFGGSFDSS